MNIHNVTGTVYLPNGDPAANTTLQFKLLSDLAVNNGHTIPIVVNAVTDDFGFLNCNLVVPQKGCWRWMYIRPFGKKLFFFLSSRSNNDISVILRENSTYCPPDEPDCGVIPDIIYTWTWPVNTIPFGDNSEGYVRTERSPGYEPVDKAYLMRQGGGGYKSTRFGMALIPANFDLVCAQVLCKSSSGHGLIVAQKYGDAVSGTRTPISIGEYNWYALTPVSVVRGADVWINSDIPTTTTGHTIGIKEIRFGFKSY